MSDELSGRERVLLALSHQTTDRVPMAMVCSGLNPPAHAALEAYLGETCGQSVAEYLFPLIDIVSVEPDYVGPPLAPGSDIWGVKRAPMSYGAGSYDEIHYYPLADAQTVADLDRHTWPSVDWFDYAVLARKIRSVRAASDRAVLVANGNIFESCWYMRGLERTLVDFMVNPQLVHAIFRHVTDFYREYFSRILAAGDGEIDLVFTADDIGGQRGLLMSLAMWEQFLKPYHSELNNLIHEFDAKVIYHSDGSVTEAVPGLIDMGIDCLQALQFSAHNMDPVFLKRSYGEWLCFEGGISVQTTLPLGTVKEVEDEVQERIRVLAKNGGYILGPSHAIQAGTPPANIVAMFETARMCPLP